MLLLLLLCVCLPVWLLSFLPSLFLSPRRYAVKCVYVGKYAYIDYPTCLLDKYKNGNNYEDIRKEKNILWTSTSEKYGCVSWRNLRIIVITSGHCLERPFSFSPCSFNVEFSHCSSFLLLFSQLGGFTILFLQVSQGKKDKNIWQVK